MGTVQLSLLAGGARAVGRTNPRHGPGEGDLRDHKQSLPRAGHRQRCGSTDCAGAIGKGSSAASRGIWGKGVILSRMSRKKRVVGTAGHIDHGKTALVKALTGIDTDRLPEEKRRGITIDLGFASWFTDEYQIGFVDVPGHERFVKNMLAGIGGIDSVLLVVAADESIKPQTREHFAICKLLGIRTGVVAITKSDLADREMIELVRLEIEELVSGR